MKLSSKSLSTIKYSFITLVLVLLPVVYYLFSYVPSKTEYFTHRNLRLLAEVSTNFSARIQGYQSWIDATLLKNDFIKNAVQARYNELPAPNNAEYNDLFQSDRIMRLVHNRLGQIENFAPEAVNFSIDSSQFERLQNNTVTSPADSFSAASTIIYKTPGNTNTDQLVIEYYGSRIDYTSLFGNFDVQIFATSDISRMLSPLINTAIFDNVLLFENDADGRVIYQMKKNEFLATHIDSISSDIQRTFKSAAISNVKMGDMFYHLFVQPVQINHLVKDDTGKAIELTLVGLVKSERFNNETRSISHFKISMFIFLVFLLLISLPLIKLQFVGRLEEISRLDLILSIFSIFVGAGVITFLLVSVYSNREDEDHLDDLLSTFAGQISTNLYDEVDAVMAQVDTISSRLFEDYGNSTYYQHILDEDESPGIETSCMADSFLWARSDSSKNLVPKFSQIAYVIRETGMQELKLNQAKTSTPRVNVSHRAYYQRIKNGRGWWNKDRPYFVESIISFTTGETSAVLSFPEPQHPDSLIVAVSLRFISLMDVVFPGSFGFAIISQDGQVQFHSDKTKNLQENLFQETDNNPSLKSAVYARVPKYVSANYLGKDHRLFVSPMPDIPWTIVAFVDLTNIHAAELNALLIAAFFFAVMIIWYAILFLGFKLIFPYRGFYWLMPRKSQETRYKLFFLILFAVSGILYFLIFQMSSTVNLALAFCTPFMVVLLTYIMFNPNRAAKLILELNNIRLILQLTALFVAIFLIVTKGFEGATWSLVILLGLLLSSIVVGRLLNKYRFPSYYVSYVSCVIAFLLVTSILPSISFFRISYNSDMDLLIKRAQRMFLQQLSKRYDRIEDNYSNIDFYGNVNKAVASARQDIRWDVYFDFFQNSTWAIEPDTLAKAAPKHPKKQETGKEAFVDVQATQLESFLYYLRSSFHIIAPENWQLYYKNSDDGIWQWQRSDKKVRLSKRLPTPQNQLPKQLVTESDLYPFRTPTNVFWSLGLLALLISIILILLYFIRKMLMLDITLPEIPKEISDTIALTHNTIFIGPPGSGKSAYIKQLTDSYLINFRLIEDVEAYSKEIDYGKTIDAQVVVLDHFDMDIDEAETTRLKLKLTKRLISTYNKTVVLVTVIDPIKHILDSPALLNTIDKRVWLQTFNSFTKVYHNIRSLDPEYEKQLLEYTKHMSQGLDEMLQEKNMTFCRALLQESNHSPFLRQVGYEILYKFDYEKDFFNQQAMVDEMLQRAETHYLAIWETCSLEEKITLLHFARNTFVTRKDADILRVLLQKGLILRQTRFVLLNESFRKFLLQKRSSKEIRDWSAQQEKSWGNIRTPVLTFFIAVALFIFITQRETFNQWIALVSTFVAGVPALLKLFSIMSPFGAKSKTDSAG